MKKRLPLFITIFLFGFYLIGQGLLNSNDPNASLVGDKDKTNKNYETQLKKSVFVDMTGHKYEFKKKLPKVVILNFWASWCTPCLEEFPSIVKLQEKYKNNKDFIFLGINTDDNNINKKIKKTVEKYDLNIPIVKDKDGALIEAFAVSAIPVSIIFIDGKVKEVSNGSKDFYSEEFLEQLKELKL